MGNGASIEPGTVPSAGSEPVAAQPSKDSDSPNEPETPPVSRKSFARKSDTVDADDDSDTMEILFQFIPYYGQGDASNDSIVRSSLSALSVEDIDQRDEYGNTLLLLACQYRCEALVRIMLNKGADPNALNSSGASCLHFACYKESMSKNIAKLLLQNGANPEVNETTYGCTPLHYCAGTGDVDFCKMLISYGAHVGTHDYYNYTAVDYAREAGMHECAVFLQKKMLMTASQGPGGFAASRGGGGLFFGKNDAIPTPSKTAITSQQSIRDMENDEWAENVDPTTGGKYYMNTTNGECLWESDYLRRRAAETKQTDNDDGYGAVIRVESTNDLLGGTAPGVDTSTPPPASEKLSSKQPGQLQSAPSFINPNNNASVDSNAMKKLLAEAKMQADDTLEKERKEFRGVIAEKDGKLAKLESEMQFHQREKERMESEMAELKRRLEGAMMSGGEAMKESQEIMNRIEQENSELKGELQQTKSALTREEEKLKSLQDTLANLESGHADKVAQAQSAAEERARQSQEMEMRHIAELKSLEDKMNESKAKYQSDLNEAKSEIHRLTREFEDRMSVYKKQRDAERDELTNEMADKQSKFAEELSNAHSLAESYKKKSAEAEERAEASEEAQRAMMEEIEEARNVQKFNAQLHRDLGREQAARKKLHNELEDMKGKIRVYVRVRPFSKNEASKGCKEAVIKDGKMSVMVKGAKGPDSKKNFDFDQVFAGSNGEGNSQQDVFKDTKHLMLSVIDGYNVCIFAYGQTGSGKTFTMIGAADIGNCLQADGEFDELAGITPRAVSEIFRLLNERTAQCTFEVSVQMFQLYRDGLEDLLYSKKKTDASGKPVGGNLKITLAEHSPTGLVHVEGANAMIATSPADVMKIFQMGAARRTTASTQMNAESSRSHLICSLVVTLTNRRTGTTTTGKLTLVDLAGSERVDKSGAQGEMLKEAQSINKSLSALGDVIAALTTGSNHVPYRNHPLTMLMSDSIGGNAKTLMFVNCSPADYNVSESNSSLSFAARCKDVTNATSAPPAQQQAQLAALKKELAKLKKDKGGAVGGAKLTRPV